MNVQNILGKPVLHSDFFGRHDEVATLRALIPTAHVLLLAPRRVGKTSLLRALAAEINRDGDGFAVYASVGPARTETDFVTKILEELYKTKRGRKLRPGRVKRWLGRAPRVKRLDFRMIGGVELERTPPPWQQHADRAFAAVCASQVPITLLVDELPILVLELAKSDPTGARVRAFLEWFRDLRDRPEATKLRFVLAGSVGLDNVTRRYNLSGTIGDLHVWRLGPFDDLTADKLLVALATSYQLELDKPVRDEICRSVEWLIPFHLQMMFAALRTRVHAARQPPTVEMVAAAVEDVITTNPSFPHWDERLHDAFGKPGVDIARNMLLVSARDPDGATDDVIMQSAAALVADPEDRRREVTWIREVLLHDGYLVEHRGRWRFRSGLLRRYWTRNAR